MIINPVRILNLNKLTDSNKIDWIKLEDNYQVLFEDEKVYRVAISKEDFETMKNVFRTKSSSRLDSDSVYLQARRKGYCRYS